MRHKGKLLFAALLVMLLASPIFMASMASAEEQTYTITETQITTSGKAFGPNIYGDKIVYENSQSDNYPHGIYVHDLSTGKDTQIAVETSPQGIPNIYENRIVWTRNVNSYQGESDVEMYDISTAETIHITDDHKSSWPDIYGNNVVYQNGTGPSIYLCDVQTGERTKIADNGNIPSIYGSKVVYQRNYDVYLYDILNAQTTQITRGGQAVYADIYNDKIAWRDNKNTMHVYDISTSKETIIAPANYSEIPAIYGDRVVWSDSRDNVFNQNIYMYNISNSQITQITTNGHANAPSIYNDRIVWQDQRGGTGSVDIYMATVSLATPEPFKEIIDTTFSPNPNGYNFINFGTPKLAEDYFRNTFGQELINNNPDISKKFYDEIYSTSANSGNCFGISSTSLELYKNDLKSWNYALGDVAYWFFVPSYTVTVEDWINYYQGRYYSTAMNQNNQRGPTNVYNTIKNRMYDNKNWLSDPMVISYWWWSDTYTDKNNNQKYDEGEPYGWLNLGNIHGKIQVSGHAVVPYKIVESPVYGTAKVYVYDSNHPGSKDIYFEFNLNQNTVTPLMNETTNKYATAGFQDNYGRINANPIMVVSLSAINQPPNRLPPIDGVSSAAHLFYTDTNGNHLGYLNGEFVSGIQGAYAIPPIPGQDITSVTFDEMYYIPDLNLKREIIGLSDNTTTISVFKANSLITVQEQVSSGSVDKLNIPKEGSSVEFVSGKETPSLILMLEKENTGVAQIAHLNVSQIEANGAINLSNVDGTIVVQNHGLPRTCSLYLEQVGASPNSDDSIKNFVVEGGSTVFIKPSNWNDIAKSEVTIEHDIGSDGIIDSTETVRPIEAEVTFDPDTLNLGSGGNWVTAYIDLQQGYSASNIDIGSIFLNGIVPAVSNPQYGFVTNESEYLTDIDADGISERMFKFNREEVESILKAGDKVIVTITGKVEYDNGISSGMASFEGSDLIKVVEKSSKKDKTKK